jgi:Mg/Co/Ni transporter MgtE
VPELPELTLAFLQQRPESAARTLEGLTAADAAEILRRMPARISAPVAAAMSSLSAARCAAELPAGAAAALCAALSWSDAAALLRQLQPQARLTVLAELPEKLARRFSRSLAYADDVVGAWIELDVPAVPDDRNVGEALQLLANSPAHSGSHLLLTDVAQRYKGTIPLGALVKSAATAALSELAQRDVQPLRDSASLISVTENPGWDLATVLPVVSHRGELLGGLSRRTLHKAMRQAGPPPQQAGTSLAAEMIRAYLQSGEGLLRLLLQGKTGMGGGDAGGRR